MNRIRELRKERGWTQTELAEQLSTKQQSVQRYETGERDLDTGNIGKLCDIFGVTADYLLCRSSLRAFDLRDEEEQLVQSFRGLSPAGREYVLYSLALAKLAHSEKNLAVPDVETAE